MAGFSPSSSTRALHGLLLIFMVALSANGDEGTWDTLNSWPSHRFHGLMDKRRDFPCAVNQNVEANPIQKVVDDECDFDHITRRDFPRDFLFGASTASLETEGSTVLGGRGPSVWEVYIDKYPERIVDGSDICRAIDSFRRYKEDVQRVVELGIKHYKFSISWPRILPRGSLSGGIRKEGIEYYNNLINELLKYGIEPIVTLLHFDVPQALQESYGGFVSPKIVDDFKDYAEVCFTEFGDRVHKWMTINEPIVMAIFGYDLGTAPPGRCSPPTCPAGNSSTEPYLVNHHIILAHATVYRLYEKKFKATQKGEIGISHVGTYPVPYNLSSPEDIAASRRALDYSIGCYTEPLVFGHYPKSMQELAKDRLPIFSETEKKLVKGAVDFIGINYYTSRYARNANKSEEPPRYSTDMLATLPIENATGVPIGIQSSGNQVIYIYPKGIQQLVEFMDKTYNHPIMYITENGIADPIIDNITLEVALNDTERIFFIKSHLCYLNKAIKNKANVKGYFHWNLFDDFEWGDGYQSRFGFFYIDYKNNLTRIAKKSSKWFNSFLQGANDVDDDNDKGAKWYKRSLLSA